MYVVMSGSKRRLSVSTFQILNFDVKNKCTWGMWGLKTDHSFHEHIIRNVSVVPLLSTSFHTWSNSFPGFGLFLVRNDL